MFQTTVDGVPVFCAAGPPPLSAGLVFGVGRRDETFVSGGVTHLVEHLAMRAVGRTTIESNAAVDLTATEFVATGSPDRVAAFLGAVCTALADLPTEHLAVEADVLRAEDATIAAPPVALLLGTLYGVEGVGLASVRDPALRSLGDSALREWTRKYFCRGNAALWLSGPVPQDLRLPLADGSPPEPGLQHLRAMSLPGWGEAPLEDHVALGAALPSHPALSATIGILRARLEEELRHRRGIAYSVQADRIGLSPAARVLALTSDVRPGQALMAAQTLWREVRRLADHGPTGAEIAQEQAEVEAYLGDPRSDVDEARALAHAAVTGVPATSAAALQADADALTPDAVKEVAAAVRDATVLLVPEGVEPQLTDLHRLPEWSSAVVSGREFVRKRLRGLPKDARLVVGQEGTSLVLGGDRWITVLWQDAVGLVRQGPGEWALVGRDGFVVQVSEDDWRDGAAAVATIRQAVPPPLQVVDDDILDGGVLIVRAPAHRVSEAIALGTYGATLVANQEWTVVLPDDGRQAEAVADDVSAVVGRRTPSLVLRHHHSDVEYALLRGANEVDRHRWGGAPGNAVALAEATARPESHTAALLAMEGEPAQVLGRAVEVLGLPNEVPDLVIGAAPVTGTRIEGQGLLGGYRAATRGEFEAPPGAGGVRDRYMRLSHRRPAWFRALNALAAVFAGLVLWALVELRTGLSTWVFLLSATMCVLGLISSLWDVRPPSRGAPADPAARAGARRQQPPSETPSDS